jgi:small subunit ribosomal protein S8
MSPIADLLTAIRNAIATKKTKIKTPFSNLKYEIGKILKREGYIKDVERRGRIKKFLIFTLEYKNDGSSAISGLKLISKPGQRVYSSWREIKKVKGGWGIAIISTSKGLMTDKEARKNKIGGEIICEVW